MVECKNVPKGKPIVRGRFQLKNPVSRPLDSADEPAVLKDDFSGTQSIEGRSFQREGATAIEPEATVITCCIRYTLDPHKLADFEDYANRWPTIVQRCGGNLLGYFLPKEGANNWAIALIGFDSLAAYEAYREKLGQDEDAQANVARAAQSKCILVEDRTFLRPL
jgi:hypothetical protein